MRPGAQGGRDKPGLRNESIAAGPRTSFTSSRAPRKWLAPAVFINAPVQWSLFLPFTVSPPKRFSSRTLYKSKLLTRVYCLWLTLSMLRSGDIEVNPGSFDDLGADGASALSPPTSTQINVRRRFGSDGPSVVHHQAHTTQGAVFLQQNRSSNPISLGPRATSRSAGMRGCPVVGCRDA